MPKSNLSTLSRRVSFLGFLLMLCGTVAVAASSEEQEREYDPTDHYATHHKEGWTVLVNKDLLDDELAEPTLTLLRHRLAEVNRRVPQPALNKLHEVEIWVELNNPHGGGAEYHPSATWLANNKYNPDKAEAVEIGNAQHFLDQERRQPMLVLHELAHAYHHQFLPDGFDNKQLVEAHQRAIDSGNYDEVLHISGRRIEHYGLTSPMEHFAEASEAYFGTNDFYPFVRPELEEHDPELYELIEELWHRE